MGISERAKWLIPVIISLAGIVVPIFFSQPSGNQKSLSYEVISASEIRPPSSPVLNDLTISLGNQRLENVGITLLKLANNGKVPIARTDFDRPLVIELKKDTHLLRSTVESQIPSNLNVEISRQGNSVNVAPVLLNPNDTFVIQLVTTGPMSEPMVYSRISGAPEAERIAASPQKQSYVLKGVAGIALLLLYGLLGGVFVGLRKSLKLAEKFTLLLLSIASAYGSMSFLAEVIHENSTHAFSYKWPLSIVSSFIVALVLIITKRKVQEIYSRGRVVMEPAQKGSASH